MPHGLLRDRHASDAVAQQHRHRRQQDRALLDCKSGIGDAKAVDPIDLGIEPDHLAKSQNDSDRQHRGDQRIESGIGEEGDQAAQNQEHEHPEQENVRRR